MMLTWLGADSPRLEGARVMIGDRKLRATGALVASADEDGPAFSATYSVATGETGVVSRVSVRAVDAVGERQVQLHRSEEGIWLVDHGAGAERTDFEGAADVDVGYCVLFNALPVRRLGLLHTPATHELPMVRVRLPELSVHLVRQTYRSTPDSRVVTFTQGDFTADLTLDDNGMVLDYPGLAKRI
ncbi:MAG TPA: putative glycolipid-binding domain-containing protein [Pseudonocardiaceae bacterium]